MTHGATPWADSLAGEAGFSLLTYHQCGKQGQRSHQPINSVCATTAVSMLDTVEVINIGLLTAEARVVSTASFEMRGAESRCLHRSVLHSSRTDAAAQLVNTAVRQRFILTASIMNSSVQNVDC